MTLLDIKKLQDSDDTFERYLGALANILMSADPGYVEVEFKTYHDILEMNEVGIAVYYDSKGWRRYAITFKP